MGRVQLHFNAFLSYLLPALPILADHAKSLAPPMRLLDRVVRQL